MEHSYMAFWWSPTEAQVAYRCECGVIGRAYWTHAGGEESASRDWREHAEAARSLPPVAPAVSKRRALRLIRDVRRFWGLE